jgi:hypothetical protein
VIRPAVALEGGAAAVESESVDLEHQPRVGPAEVDLEAGDGLVGQRLRKLGGVEQGAEPALRLGTREAQINAGGQ